MFWKKKEKFLVKSPPINQDYKREITIIVLFSIFVFLAIALISYDPKDNTLFHYNNKYNHIANWAGMVGAQCAALCLFLFGTAAFFFLVSLGVFIWLLFTRISIKQERGRVGSLFLITLSTTTLCSLLAFDVTHSIPGGLIGTRLMQFFVIAFGRHGALIFLFSVLWIGLIMLIQLPFIPLVSFVFSYIKSKAITLLALLYSQLMQLWQRTWRRKNNSSAVAQLNIPASSKDELIHDLSFWGSVSGGQTTIKQQSQAKEASPAVKIAPNNRWAMVPIRVLSKLRRILNGYMYRFPNSITKKNFWSVTTPEQHSIVDIIGAAASNTKKTFKRPTNDIFFAPPEKKIIIDYTQDAAHRGKLLEEKLLHFGIKGKVTAIKTGPLITLFEYKPDIDSKISKITALEDDLAMALTANSIRILAPIPGKDVVGFEISNAVRQDVYFADILSSKEYNENKTILPLVFGVNISGIPVVQDLIRMPHLLVGGATGAGKSVGLNAMIAGLLNTATPDQMKIILIDPKRLEFLPFADIPHLIFPIVTEPARAAAVLKWVCQDMEHRYATMARAGVRNIQEYHELFNASDMPIARDGGQLPHMPFLVVVIDELADLMMVAGKEVELAIVRIAQMARASGIHMIVATQRPSVDVVTGLIKVNFPSRIAFRVSSKVDSRTILDVQGAEKLLGRGDLLYLNASSPDLMRIHGAYVSDKEINKLADWWRDQQEANYLNLNEVLKATCEQKQEEHQDVLYADVIAFIKTTDEISISMLQRYFRIGFNRSARLIEKLEIDGIIAPSQGAKPRKILR
jgi:S-DNA-T family DNA segregation ATPase FtsK/SpoIIIE